MGYALALGIIGTILGIMNFVYWAWWVRREVMKIQNGCLETRVVKERDKESPNLDLIDRIFVTATFELVRTGGQKNCYIRSWDLQLDRRLCAELQGWFEMPTEGRISQTALDATVQLPPREEFKELKLNLPERFSISRGFPKKQSMIDLYNALRALTLEDAEAIRKRIEETEQMINMKVSELRARYSIGVNRSDGKAYRYKLR